jgi:hypothetical protein
MMKKELNMPKVSASNGIRPEIRALAVLVMGKTVTPAEINAHVGTGDYAAKYVSFLNTRYGFTITANKDGRKVVSYTMIAEPANAAELRSATPKAPKAKAVKTPKVAKVTKVANPTATAIANAKAKNLETIKQVAEKFAAAKKPKTKRATKVRDFDDVTEQFGTNGEVATSYSVDKDWDSIDGTDLSKLL